MKAVKTVVFDTVYQKELQFYVHKFPSKETFSPDIIPPYKLRVNSDFS